MNYFILLALIAVAYDAPLEDDKIVGGFECRKHSVAYIVSLNSGYHFCGGSLISSSWVVSAAHCYKFWVNVRLGKHNIAVIEGTESFIDYSKVIRHPSYNSYTLDNDIIMIKLSYPVTLNSYVGTVSLPSNCASAGTSCLISGWGNTLSSGIQCHFIYIQCSSLVWIFIFIYYALGYYPDTQRCLNAPVLSDTSCNLKVLKCTG